MCDPPNRRYIAAQIGLNGALQALNIISVVQSAHVLDKLIAQLFDRTCAFDLTPFALYVPNGTLVDTGYTPLSHVHCLVPM